jgi:hypothetical protein
MATCFDVFATWDDEYDKLQGLLRDIVKKMRHDQVKMVWRINPAHKKIQTRLEQMRKLVLYAFFGFVSSFICVQFLNCKFFFF